MRFKPLRLLVIAALVWAIMIWAIVLWGVVGAVAAEPTAPSDEVLTERKQFFQSEMRRLDAEWKLIPYQYRELDEKVRVIDQEIAKRKGEKAPAEKKP